MNEMRLWGGWLVVLAGAGVIFWSISLGNWAGLGVGILLVAAGVVLVIRAVRMEIERVERELRVLMMVGEKRRKLPRKKESGLAGMTDRELRLLVEWERAKNPTPADPTPYPSPNSANLEREQVQEVEDEMDW